MKLGAQFYSIRDNTTTPEDLRKSFAEMKKIGYDVTQMSGICKIEAEELRDISDEFSLPIVCTHSSFERIVNDTDNLIKEHQTYKCPVIGIGGMPHEYRGTVENIRRFIKDITDPMKKINDAGLDFAYHNHHFEFITDKNTLLFDLLIEEAPALNFILDTYWVKYAGYDVAEYIKKIGKSRMKNIHLKDMLTEPQGDICACGAGVVDFKPIIDLCNSLGIENALVEQDNAPDSGDSYGQMAISYSYLKPLF